MSPNCRATPDSLSPFARLFPPLWPSLSRRPCSGSSCEKPGKLGMLGNCRCFCRPSLQRDAFSLRAATSSFTVINIGHLHQLSKNIQILCFPKKKQIGGFYRGFSGGSREDVPGRGQRKRRRERTPTVAGRISSNACLQYRERDPQLMPRKGQRAFRYS